MQSASGNIGGRGGAIAANVAGATILSLPNTGSNRWLLITGYAVLAIGIVMFSLQVVATIARKRV